MLKEKIKEILALNFAIKVANQILLAIEEDIKGIKVDKNMDGKMKLGYFQALNDVLKRLKKNENT